LDGQTLVRIDRNELKLPHLLLVIGLTISVPGHADSPTIKTPSPVIYLADNLDEKDNLGWCIDTIGRGFAERLHAHSCKPRGGDVQFSYDLQTKLIKSVAFPDYCMVNRPDSQSTFGLETCDPNMPEQLFTYEVSKQEIRPANNSELCVVTGPQSRSAGPFMSRALVLADCAKTDDAFKQWIIVE